MKRKGSNIAWTFESVQNAIYVLVNYNPKDRETKNYPFEIRVLRASEGSILAMDKVNPNAFGEYDSEGSWQSFEGRADKKSNNAKNYNVRFNDEKLGYKTDNKGNLTLPSCSILPVKKQDVQLGNGKTKQENFTNIDATNIMKVSQSIATSHFKKAYPQTKQARNGSGKQEQSAYKEAEKLTTFVKNKTEVYKSFVTSKGKRGTSEAVSETNARVLLSLQNALVDFSTARDEAEFYAEELEEKLTGTDN